MARIEGRKPEEENLAIPPIRVSFPKAAYVMQLEKGPEFFFSKTLFYEHKHSRGR